MDSDAGTQHDEPEEEQSRFPLAVRSQRALQIILGLFWILDAALQFQPFMFGQGFVEHNILANASGQPFVLGDLITHIGNFVSPDIAVWNTFFALIQLFIGVGLLFRRTVRPALAVSFAWAIGVWVIGEGLGMLFTGTASALTGAPGSVFVYGLLGLMAWPRPPRRWVGWSDRPAGIASSAAAQGIGRSITPLAVWAGYWSLAAVLFLLPANRTTTSVQSAIVGMADGTPGWYASFLTHLGNVFSTTGTQTAWILAAVSVAIGLGPSGGAATGVVPGRRRAARLLDVDRRSGPRRRCLHRLGHRPQHRAVGDPAGRGHGAHRHCVEGSLAFARRRGPAAEPGGGRPRHRRPRRRAGPERQLSRVGDGRVVEQRHERHGHGRRERVELEHEQPVGHGQHLRAAPDRPQDLGARPGQHARS